MKLKEVKYEKASRKDFAKVGDYIEMPNLIKVQRDSYEWFLEEGLGEVLKDISPIEDYSGNLVLEFFDYYMEEKTKYTVEEAKERDATYSTRLHVKVRLINRETGEIKEQEIYLGDFPLMTDSGTFVINGAERVVVSQLVRSPSCYYAEEFDTKTGKKTYTSTVMPLRGAWLEYETDGNDIFWVRVDRTRKVPVTTLLRAIGIITDDQIRELFGDEELLKATINKDTIKDRSDYTDYAVMINGEWGSGKTHFWNHKIRKKIESMQLNGKKFTTIYMSLYGISNLEEISKKIFIETTQLMDKNLRKFMNANEQSTIPEYAKTGIDMANFFGVTQNGDKLDYAEFFSTDDKVLCFDDLERANVDVIDILGYINNFVEHDRSSEYS